MSPTTHEIQQVWPIIREIGEEYAEEKAVDFEDGSGSRDD